MKNLKKISIFLGRGIEGCGVTKFTLEFVNWLIKNNYEYSIYALNNKSWSREKSHDINNIIKIDFENESEVNSLINECNKSDIVIINSLPPKKNVSDIVKSNYDKFISLINIPIIFFQHDHSIHSIIRNYGIEKTVNKSSIIFVHSRKNDFSKYIENINQKNSKNTFSSFFNNEKRTSNKNYKIFSFQPGMDFDSVRSKYWKEIENTKFNTHKWIGRTTPWKGYYEMLNFHNKFLRPNMQITTLEGIEKSIQFSNLREYCDFYESIYKKDFVDENKIEPGSKAYIYGPYIHEKLLERLSKSTFGYQLTLLKDDFIERSIEYTHCEIASVGTIPVFSKEIGERCNHRKFEKKLIECNDNGTVWFDRNNMKLTYEVIEKISKDIVMRNEWREMAFEFYKFHQDSKFTFSEIIEKIKNNII